MFQREQTNQLYLKAKVELCDYTHRIYAQPVDGAKVLRKNQANKWEVKMLCGPNTFLGTVFHRKRRTNVWLKLKKTVDIWKRKMNALTFCTTIL